MERSEVTDQNSLIIYRLDESERKSDEHRAEIKATLNRVFEQVSKTNGRVTKLEMWQQRMIGALVAFGAVLSAIGVMVGWFVSAHWSH